MPGVIGLPPNRPAKIDLASIGERSDPGAGGAPNQRASDGSADHQPAKRTDARTDSAATECTVTGGVAAGAERRQQKQKNETAQLSVS